MCSLCEENYYFSFIAFIFQMVSHIIQNLLNASETAFPIVYSAQNSNN